MKNLIKFTNNKDTRITSLELASILDTNHKSIIQSIRARLIPELERKAKNRSALRGAPSISEEVESGFYTDKLNRKQKIYNLTEKQALFIAMPYSNELQMRVLDQVEAMHDKINDRNNEILSLKSEQLKEQKMLVSKLNKDLSKKDPKMNRVRWDGVELLLKNSELKVQNQILKNKLDKIEMNIAVKAVEEEDEKKYDWKKHYKLINSMRRSKKTRRRLYN